MRTIICVLVSTLLAVAAVAGEPTAILERSIGRVILTHDKYPYGGLRVAEAIDREYKNIQKLPVQQRVRFFWSVLMNVKLDAGYSLDFVELIARDCPREFEREITTFLNKNWEGGPPQPQGNIAKRTLISLQLLRERNEAHPPSR